MKTFIASVILIFSLSFPLFAQLYFPPVDSDNWETLSPDSLNWCPEKIEELYDLLESKNTKAFILLKDGKIVLEEYFNDHDADKLWYWASAGKTLIATLTGIAQEEGYLSITDPTANYLGDAWTSCTPEEEERITIWNQLTMTSGLDDFFDQRHCTESTCLNCIEEVGNRWAYHNAPYTLLSNVISSATSVSFKTYLKQKIANPIGMDGNFIEQGYNQLFVSTPRSMARFGLLILNEGKWEETAILSDEDYFRDMVTPSQTINPSYGYLWWLNGQDRLMIPQSQLVFNRSMSPNAPSDMFAAMGKNGQFINVIPSENMVWIRMGELPDSASVPFIFNDEIWGQLNQLECNISSTEDLPDYSNSVNIYPNPVVDAFTLSIENALDQNIHYRIVNTMGMEVLSGDFHGPVMNLRMNGLLDPGVYFIQLETKDWKAHKRISILN